MLFFFIWLGAPVLLVLALVCYLSLRKDHPGRSMFLAGAISLLSSFVMFFTVWLLLPVFVLLPLSLYFAFQCYKKTVLRFPGAPVLARLCGLLPMAVALAALPAANVFFEGSFQA